MTRVPEVEFMGESKVEERLGLVADAVHGESKEVHLDIRIIKLNVDH